MSLFYWRTIERREFRVCSPCEKKLDNDPARAAYFTVLRDGASVWLVCKECGRKERFTGDEESIEILIAAALRASKDADESGFGSGARDILRDALERVGVNWRAR